MADFCKQCADELGFTTDLAGMTTTKHTEAGLYCVVLCEGCGPIQVDHDGRCISHNCDCKHGSAKPLTMYEAAKAAGKVKRDAKSDKTRT